MWLFQIMWLLLYVNWTFCLRISEKQQPKTGTMSVLHYTFTLISYFCSTTSQGTAWTDLLICTAVTWWTFQTYLTLWVPTSLHHLKMIRQTNLCIHVLITFTRTDWKGFWHKEEVQDLLSLRRQHQLSKGIPPTNTKQDIIKYIIYIGSKKYC